ncbi:MAG TPA: signal peptidase II [Acidimicrobiales bacterium]|nr:signal peptidase II [Acidimicrobiales bacterium]
MTQGPSGPLSGDQGPPGGPTAPVRSARRTALLIAVAAAVVALDQLSKFWATSVLYDGPIELVGSLRLALTTNTAGAFGLGGSYVPFLALGALGLVIWMALTGEATKRPLVSVAAGLVLGGAIGNLLDRMFRSPGFLRGAVVDFVDLRWWPVFNLADAAITCGCILLLLSGFRGRKA